MTPRDSNLAVARLFEEIAQSLEVAGEQGHRLRAYRRAARGVAATPEPLEQLAAEGRLREIHGVGASLAALIAEFLETGGMRTHQRLVDEHPPGLAPLLRAHGFGPAGVQALHAARSRRRRAVGPRGTAGAGSWAAAGRSAVGRAAGLASSRASNAPQVRLGNRLAGGPAAE